SQFPAVKPDSEAQWQRATAANTHSRRGGLDPMTDNVYTSDVTVDQATTAQLAESVRLREERIADSIDELVGRIHPKVLVTRAVNKAKSGGVEDDGSPKPEALALGAGTVLGVAALIVGLSGRNKRG